MRYTKKPVTIDAVQWTGDNQAEVEAFIGAHDGYIKGDYVDIGTLEGLMVASPGDWLIRGVQGELYPCKPDIFEATYAPGIPRPRPMEVFIDCEWNGYRGKLITMALVAMDGRELYAGVPMHEELVPWVQEHVVPAIGDPENLTGKLELASRLYRFLEPYESVHIIADWPEDLEHLCRVIVTGPGTRIPTPRLTMEVRRDLDSTQSCLPHNALADARAIKDHYLSLMGDV